MAKLAREPVKAVAYLRTSSAANVGTDKDSERRQRTAIAGYAKAHGFAIADADWYYDAAVSGADPIEDRPGFAAVLDRIDGNGVRTIIVEDASRFARDMKAHVLGISLLRQRGVSLLTATGQDLTDDRDEMAEAMVSIAAAFATLEKKRLVKKLKAARDRVIADQGRCGGRRSLAETHPVAVALAKRLHRASPKTGERRSLRTIATALAEAGHVNERGQPFNAKSIKAMIGGPAPTTPATP